MTVSSETLQSISTPERLETRLGMLEFRDGVPSGETVNTVYDHLDFVHGLNVFLNGYAGASTYESAPRRDASRSTQIHRAVLETTFQ